MINRLLLFSFLFIITACCGTRGPRMKAGFAPRINLVEIVFKGLNDKILFAGPVKFEQEKSRDIIALDFTGEFIDRKCDSVIFRYTIINKIKDFSFSDISIVGNDTLFTTDKFILMFEEPQDKYFHHRYAFTTSFSVFQKMLEAENPELIFGKQHIFKAGRRWKKDAREISDKILLITSGYL